MAGNRWCRTAIAATCIVALTCDAPLALAQPSSPPPPSSAQSCKLQRIAGNPNCQPPPSAGAIALPQPAPSSTNTNGNGGRNNNNNGGGVDLATILAVAAGIVLAAVLAKSLTGSKNASVSDLERNGPKTPEKELLGQYEVQGVVYPDWPLVVEVDAAPDATTFLQVVTADGKKDTIAPMVLSDAGGRPWGDGAVIRPREVERTERGTLAKFALPHDIGQGGSGGFHSARLAVVSGRMQDGKFVYAPVDVLALGAGPNAVGSAAVEITRFDPDPRARRADYEVTFNARRTFTNLRGELIRREQSRSGTKRVTMASQDICTGSNQLNVCQDAPPRVPFPIDGSWPAGNGGQLGAGQSYHMELRAHPSTNAPGGGWIIAQAPQVVTWP